MTKYLRATDFVILRNVPVDCRHSTALERCPIHVATLLNEDGFEKSNHLMGHSHNVFMEDRLHDWQWENGQFRFYSRVPSGPADVLVVFAAEQVEASPQEVADMHGYQIKFDIMTGKPVAPLV